jgi:hypothetical protein
MRCFGRSAWSHRFECCTQASSKALSSKLPVAKLRTLVIYDDAQVGSECCLKALPLKLAQRL